MYSGHLVYFFLFVVSRKIWQPNPGMQAGIKKLTQLLSVSARKFYPIKLSSLHQGDQMSFF
jgi:hypothetical protein